MTASCSFPGPWRVDVTEGGHFVVNGFLSLLRLSSKRRGAAQQLYDTCRGGGDSGSDRAPAGAGEISAHLKMRHLESQTKRLGCSGLGIGQLRFAE